jgi:hypothetical protein
MSTADIGVVVIAVGALAIDWVLVARLSIRVHEFANVWSLLMQEHEEKHRHRFRPICDSLISQNFALFEIETGLGLQRKGRNE